MFFNIFISRIVNTDWSSLNTLFCVKISINFHHASTISGWPNRQVCMKGYDDGLFNITYFAHDKIIIYAFIIYKKAFIIYKNLKRFYLCVYYIICVALFVWICREK